MYLLPAAAAALLGPASLWAVLVTGAAVALLVLCFAEASSYFDEPGGGYIYTREAFGEFVGFEVGWMTWLARIASVASLSNGFAQALEFVARYPRIYVVEQNRDGQMADLLRLERPDLAPRIRSVRHYDGMPIDAKSVTDQILAQMRSSQAAASSRPSCEKLSARTSLG